MKFDKILENNTLWAIREDDADGFVDYLSEIE